MVKGLTSLLVKVSNKGGGYCEYRYLRDDTKRHPLNVVQQFPLSGSDKSLLCFQEGCVVIPIHDVNGNRKRVQRDEDSQPLGESDQLSVHLLDTSPSLHRLYLRKFRNPFFEHPSEARENR